MILSNHIETAFQLCQSKFSFDREKGYDQLLQIVRQKHNIVKLLDEKTNIISGICSCLLLSSSILSPVSTNEKIKALMILEACCIINPILACTFSFSQGIPLLIKIIKTESAEIQLQALDTLQASFLYEPNVSIFKNLDGNTLLTMIQSNTLVKPKCIETSVLMSKISDSTTVQKEVETIFDALGAPMTATVK